MQPQTPSPSDAVSHFRLLELLGRGGMGVVYKALDLRLERTVALKLLAPERGRSEEARRRFLHEARAASVLDHPNICALYEFGETEDGRLFLVMAFCEGEPLACRIERGPLPVALAVDFAAQVAAGLAAAHAKGIVHRDVKPSNLMVTPDERVKIVDFGIARRADQTMLTREGVALGSTAYMSPEQLRGQPVDPRTDLWSLGVVLYEMVTGERPFAGPQSELVWTILEGGFRPLAARRPGLPPDLERIVACALEKPVARRYPSAAALREDLLAVDLRSGSAPLKLEETTLVQVPPAGAPSAPGAVVPVTREVSTLALPPGMSLAHYRVGAPLGGGGMGVIYQAEDTRLGRTVALKFLAPERTRDPEAKARFLKEARAASALDHPNLCTIHEVGETVEGQLYLAMPCYDGETLARRIERGPLPVAEALDLACQAARGLAKAHGRGIVHRDVKPANLMVTGDSVVKILDFGIAQLLGEGVPGSGSAVGTPAYMSPEQARGEAVGPATDVWSLGVVLYEMLAGRRPFAGGSVLAVLHGIQTEEPAPLAGPEKLARIVARMLAKDPAARYGTAAEALAELEAVRSAVDRPGRAFRVWAGVSLLLIPLLATAGFFLWRRGNARPFQATFTRLTDLEGKETYPSISPDGSRFVYVKTVDGRSHLFLQKVGGSAPVDLSRDASTDDTQPAFSPDGKQLAFRSERAGGGLFLFDLASGAVRRLTDDGYNPAWSPDGRTLAFATEGVRTPNVRLTHSELWRVDLAGGVPRRLATGGDAVQPSWSPDGRRIAFWGAQNGQRAIWTVPVGGGEPLAAVRDSHLNWNPVWSPDGRYLYFASDRSGSMNLWRVAVDEDSGRVEGTLESITTPAPWSGFLSLSRDGRRLVYATDESRSNLERAALDPGTGRIAGPFVPVTKGERAVRSCSPSPDGRWVACDTATPQEDLFVVPAQGGEVRQLTHDAYKDRSPKWSPDGSRILFYSNRSGKFEAWAVHPDGQGLEQLTTTRRDNVFNPLWSPDGGKLACFLGWNGEAVIDLSRPPAARTPEILPTVGFVATSWSGQGRLAGQSGDGTLALYSFADRSYEHLRVRGHKFCWLADGQRLLFLDQGKVMGFDSRTREVWEIAAPAPDSSYTELSVRRADLFVVRTMEEGNICLLTARVARD